MNKSLYPTILIALGLSALPAAAQSVSVNFGSNEGNGSIDNASALTAGAIPVAGMHWTNAATANSSAADLIDSTGAATTTDVTHDAELGAARRFARSVVRVR